MRSLAFVLRPLVSFGVALAIGWGCGEGDEGDSPDQAGDACEHVEDCYPDVDHGDLLGDVQCLHDVPGGYCTHLCQTDADCCAVDDECDTDLPQLCAPFQSTGMRMCFLSCEASDVGGDAEGYCHEHVSDAFGCRASGGGDPKKVCVP